MQKQTLKPNTTQRSNYLPVAIYQELASAESSRQGPEREKLEARTIKADLETSHIQSFRAPIAMVPHYF